MEKIIEIGEMRNTVIKVLAEMGCECEFDEEGLVNFSINTDSYSEEVKSYLEDVVFSISLDEQLRYIVIHEDCWKTVKLNDGDKVEKMKYAINQANFAFSVSTAYFINEEERIMEVGCTTNIPYLPDENYLKEYLEKKLYDIFIANRLLDHFLEE